VVYLEKKLLNPVPADKSYYCLRCDRDFFRLYADGEVRCYTCGSEMTNLRVTMEAK
jgi:DNA-directed RNA polymerase subunit RPC12/RpoP